MPTHDVHPNQTLRSATIPSEVHCVFIPELGTIVGGKYRLLGRLGAGGMGTVYEAENLITLKRAAVKWLHPEYAERAQGTQRLVHEARATSRIRHDNVVDVYDVVEEELAVFLVMELLRGEPLARQLERDDQPVHELIALLLAAMRGVAAAHAAGVVHRDIKPENIFLAREPGYAALVPKVIDFGISKMFQQDGSDSTRSGITMGTPKYVSYEQLLGSRDVDSRTDVYAFGVMLYEALTGRPPYDEAKTFAEQAVRFVTQVPEPPRQLRPAIPAPLASLVERAIAKDREQRVPTMDAFVQALEPFARADSFDPPLLARAQGSAASRAPTAESSLASNGRARAATVASAFPVDGSPQGEPRPARVRRSLPAGPRAPRFAFVGVALLLLLALAALSHREGAASGEVGEAARAVDAGLTSLSVVLAKQPADVQRQQVRSGTVEPTTESKTALSVPEARAPIAVRPLTRERHHKPLPTRDKDVSGQSVVLPTTVVDAGSSSASSFHRAGHLLRREF
jgi:serine/threonine protein kinase